jgi:hypothetical protein
MRRFLNGCGNCRASLCLLAADALPEQERNPVENHLTNCADCRKYYEELKSVTTPLTNWEKAFSQLEPNQNARTHWAGDFQAVTAPVRPPQFTLMFSILDWCRDMIWPCRRIWTGFAAIWLMILAVDFSARDTGPSVARPELLRALLKSEGFLADLTKPGEIRVAVPPKPSPSKPT